MKAPSIHHVFFCAVTLASLAVAPLTSAQMLFSSGYSRWESSLAGSYIHFADRSYGHDATVVAGQYQQYAEPFNFYRAFAVVNLPQFKGVVTPGQVGIPPNELDPSITQLRVNVTSATLNIPGITLRQTWYIDLPVDIRLTSLSSQQLFDQTIDPKTAFNALGNGTLLAHEIISPGPAQNGDDGYSFNLSNAFTQYLNSSNGGQAVLSFTVPLIRDSKLDNIEQMFFDIPMSIVTWFDGYTADTPPFSAVPESSTYALLGAVLCAAVALWRRRASVAV